MKISINAFKQLKKYWKYIAKKEQLGNFSDNNFLDNTEWIHDSAVIDRINHEKGRWHIRLVFAHPTKSTNFIIRSIRSCSSFQKAQFEAQFLRRTAAKDPRGTVEITVDAFDCPLN